MEAISNIYYMQGNYNQDYRFWLGPGVAPDVVRNPKFQKTALDRLRQRRVECRNFLNTILVNPPVRQGQVVPVKNAANP